MSPRFPSGTRIRGGDGISAEAQAGPLSMPSTRSPQSPPCPQVVMGGGTWQVLSDTLPKEDRQGSSPARSSSRSTPRGLPAMAPLWGQGFLVTRAPGRQALAQERVAHTEPSLSSRAHPSPGPATWTGTPVPTQGQWQAVWPAGLSGSFPGKPWPCWTRSLAEVAPPWEELGLARASSSPGASRGPSCFSSSTPRAVLTAQQCP